MPSSHSTSCESGALSKSCAAVSFMPQCFAPQMRSLAPPQPLDLPPLHLPPPSEQVSDASIDSAVQHLRGMCLCGFGFGGKTAGGMTGSVLAAL
jgi:hypothetical protein